MYKDTASSKEISLTVNDKTDKTNTKQKQEESARERALCQLTECF